MTWRINSELSSWTVAWPTPGDEPVAAQQPTAQQASLPSVPQRVSLVAIGCHSERQLAVACYKAAAARAGIADEQA